MASTLTITPRYGRCSSMLLERTGLIATTRVTGWLECDTKRRLCMRFRLLQVIKKNIMDRSRQILTSNGPPMPNHSTQTLKKIEGAFKNGQSRETGSIGHKTQNEDKNTQHKKLQT